MPLKKMESFWNQRPKKLEKICLEVIKRECCSENDSIFSKIFHLPRPVVESIFDYLSNCAAVTDGVLKLFHDARKIPAKIYLTSIGTSIAVNGLSVFSSYQLTDLTLHFEGNTKVPGIHDLWRFFQGAQNSLKSLKLFRYPTVIAGQGHVFDFVTKFQNLGQLVLHSMSEDNELTNERWLNLVKRCPSLRMVEIFCPKNVSDLSLNSYILPENCHYIEQLRLPSLYNGHGILSAEGGIQGFLHLNTLTHLDLSVDDDPESSDQELLNERKMRHRFIEDFITRLTCKETLPNLTSLDLSGWKCLHSEYITMLLESHERLWFLGLCLIDVDYTKESSVCAKWENLQISGTFLEEQLILSLKIYPNRALYLREALKSLFVISASWIERRPDIIQLILQIMSLHRTDHLLQLAGTACLYNLTKNDPKLKPVPSSLLIAAGELSLHALAMFLSHEKRQIMKNCLLIFCNDRLLHHPQFKRYAISRVCLDCMLKVPESLDRHITRMAVAIVSVLACKITSKETSQLTGAEEMKLLLNLARSRILDQRSDGTLKFDLSALWNLTDESPKACRLFVEYGGLDLYVDLLGAFPEEHSIQIKVLGLLNNIAEVSELHDAMITDDLMKYVSELVNSKEKSVSYFAGGIIANLAYGWNYKYELQVTTKQELLDKLDSAIERWESLECEIVTYRSFTPFIGLLESHHLPAVQKFSLWAIHHVCTLNSERYAELMTAECIERLEVLRKRLTFTAPKQATLIDEVFKACKIGPNEQEK